ncbi:MAG: hypothetical protein HC896_05795 [Bacteroidales bacterium]|nr:hypothetical protein [Bacteroidales bacterium]
MKAQTETHLLRFPDIHENNIVFSYAGDLYLTSINGGIARRVTHHEGYEIFPRFSPDGAYIAYTAEYNGTNEVYTIPYAGGNPQRLTYTASLGRDDVAERMGPNNIAMDWTRDGQQVVYRSRQLSFNSFIGQLFTVPKNGGLSQQLPFSEAGFCQYAPDGTKLAFNRVFREFRTWKHYRGGMADDIWVFDFTNDCLINVTNNPAQDVFPMWIGDKLYFLSDRDTTMNLFVYDFFAETTTKLTNFNDFDIKFPANDNKHIVFENGGRIYTYNIENSKLNEVKIYISNELPGKQMRWVDAADRVTSFDASPNGERVLLSARGDVFNLPANQGITVNLTRSDSVHERQAVWSPNGDMVAYISDVGGEYEIYVANQLGKQPAKQITNGNSTYIFNIKWSPNGKYILWNDRDFKLSCTDVKTLETKEIAQSSISVIDEFNWAPDNRYITYADYGANFLAMVYVYDMQTETTHQITPMWYHAGNPSFSDNGNFLVYSSNRSFTPLYSHTEWNHAYVDMGRLYLVNLREEKILFCLKTTRYRPKPKRIALKKKPARASTSILTR